MKEYLSVLESENYYHIYNHAVGQDNIFENDNNYIFFLKKYSQYIFPVADTFAYCLMPNHFHFAIRIKPENKIELVIKILSKFETLTKLNYTKFLSKQFSNLFSSYTQAFNKQHSRIGGLFQRPFKRIRIVSNENLCNLIHYIHFNPVHHEFVYDMRDWKYSSFESFFSEKATLLKRDEVIDWFDNKENFFAFHQKEIDEKIFIDME